MQRGSRPDEAKMESLIQANDRQLYQQLGQTVQALAEDPSIAGTYTEEVDQALGFQDDVINLGRNLFRRWSAEANKLVCGTDADNSGMRQVVIDAIGGNAGTVVAILAGLLVSQFALAPAVASLVAALVIKTFLKPTYEEMCQEWSQHVG